MRLLATALLSLLSVGAFGCDQSSSSSADMSALPTCSEICSKYLTCELQTGFVGSTNALVPCENGCFNMSELDRFTAQQCSTHDCSYLINCAMGLGLKLQPKPMPDLSDHD